MALSKYWAGNVYGTNTGRLFLQIDGQENSIYGTLRFNDDQHGIVTFSVSASFKDGRLSLSGKPLTSSEGVVFGDLNGHARLGERGNLCGTWETTIGSAGTFVLFPHGMAADENSESADKPKHFFAKRHTFRPVVLEKDNIVKIASDFQKDFPGSEVVVTVSTATEWSTYLQEFKDSDFSCPKASWIKVFVQAPEAAGLNRILVVEFGQAENFAIAQSVDESWAIGRIERLRADLTPYERTYSANFKKLGLGIIQLLFLAMVVYLPSIDSLFQRSVYALGIVAIAQIFLVTHARFVPNALILLKPRGPGLLERLSPHFVSWFIATLAAISAWLFTTKIDSIGLIFEKLLAS